jgi:hypothetical protein
LKNKRSIGLLGLFIVAFALLACEASNVVALVVKPTVTPTRTLRPTFTPRPSATPTPQDTATPQPTDTPEPSIAPTRRVVVATPKPVATKPPAPPPLPVSIADGYVCPQSGPVWQVIARVNRSTPPSIFLGGYTIALLNSNGQILKTDVTVPDGQQVNGLWINCRVDKVFPYNSKIDAPEYRGQAGPFIVRVIKSANDPTPLSPDFKVDFTQQAIWFVFFTAPG